MADGIFGGLETPFPIREDRRMGRRLHERTARQPATTDRRGRADRASGRSARRGAFARPRVARRPTGGAVAAAATTDEIFD